MCYNTSSFVLYLSSVHVVSIVSPGSEINPVSPEGPPPPSKLIDSGSNPGT